MLPSGPVNSFADIDNDEHVAARKIFKTVPHATAGAIRSVATPMRFSRSETKDKSAAPPLGNDTRRILTEMLGVSDEELDRLQTSNVI